MDYPQRTRLKVLGYARVEDAREATRDLVQEVAEVDVRRTVERVFLVEIVSFDWNCPKYITPRYTAEQVQGVIAPLQARIAELEARLKSCKV